MSSSSTSASEHAGRAARRYLAVLAGMVALALLLVAGLFVTGSGVRLDGYMDYVVVRMEQKNALAAARSGRRILVHAGSNAFFNVHAAEIEAATGLAALNMATNANNGLRFLLFHAEEVARPGDIVVLPLEANLYREPAITSYAANVDHALGGSFFRALTMEDRLTYLRQIPLERLLKALPARLGLLPEPEADWAYPINAHGDLMLPEADPARLSGVISGVGTPLALRPDPAALAVIARFTERMRARGITVLFTLPGIIEAMAPTDETVRRFAAALEEAGGRFLPLEGNGAIPAEMMFDTAYHGATAGGRLYTGRLITALCADGELALACDEAQLSAAGERARWAEHQSYLVAADPPLAPLQPVAAPQPVALPAGEALGFSVALLRRCDNRLTLTFDGEGAATVTVDGTEARQAVSGPTTLDLALDGRPGLVGAVVTAAPGAAVSLVSVWRESTCRGRRTR